MPVRELRNQEAQHDSGAILRSHGREAVQFQLDDRVMTLGVERGVRSDVFYLPRTLRWDDGDPLPDEVVALVRPVIEEVNSFWGSASVFQEIQGE